MDGQRMMTVKELADYLHIATSTVYRMAEQGGLPALKVGVGWRFDVRVIDEWRFKKQRVASPNGRRRERPLEGTVFRT